MKKLMVACFVACFVASSWGAVEYPLHYEAETTVTAPERQGVWTGTMDVPATGDYELFFLCHNAVERVQGVLTVNGVEVESLAMPRSGIGDGDLRRIKIASRVALEKGIVQLSWRVDDLAVANGMIVDKMMLKRVSASREWQLVWEENFEVPGTPDESVWRTEDGFLRNHEVQYYMGMRPENILVQDGILTITGRREKVSNQYYNAQSDDWRYNTPSAEFTSATIDTFGKVPGWQYGKMEARLKVSGGRGVWPAFWTMGESGFREGWPKCGEIDIMEFFGKSNNRITNAAHFFSPQANGHKSFDDWGVQHPYGEQIEDNFHVYGVVWDEEKIQWYMDGKVTSEIFRKDYDSWCFDNPQYVILNLALGSYSGDVPEEFQQVQYQVDYVRVYQ